MASKAYRTAPIPTEGIPPGVPYIVSNEAAERFSFYGMKAILVVFMTKFLMDHQGNLDVMTDSEARGYYHLFVGAAYFFPFFGALLADGFLGKYPTIIYLSVVYCLGHIALAIDDTRMGLMIGLTLIAIGAGGIKPCVSAHVGDQFGKTNSHLIPRVFSWFYFAINFGSMSSYFATPWLLKHYGPWAAFGLPGVLMLLATFVFWMGRNSFVHIPAGGMGFVREVFSPKGLGALGQLMVVYLFIAVFWSLYDQTGAAWVLQAQQMDRHFLGIEWLPSQVQSVNPLMILICIPLFSYVVYPQMGRFFKVTPLKKIGIGLFISAFSFVVCAYIEGQIQAGNQPNIGWQFLAYLFLTMGEVMVSITGLEFSYTQAPKKMKSLVMGFFFWSITFGNWFTAGVNYFMMDADGNNRLEGPAYYWFFVILILVTSGLFAIYAQFFKEKTYIQDEQSVDGAESTEAA